MMKLRLNILCRIFACIVHSSRKLINNFHGNVQLHVIALLFFRQQAIYRELFNITLYESQFVQKFLTYFDEIEKIPE